MTSQPTLFQRSLVELIGTAMLVWIGAGSAAFNGVNGVLLLGPSSPQCCTPT